MKVQDVTYDHNVIINNRLFCINTTFTAKDETSTDADWARVCLSGYYPDISGPERMQTLIFKPGQDVDAYLPVKEKFWSKA